MEEEEEVDLTSEHDVIQYCTIVVSGEPNGALGSRGFRHSPVRGVLRGTSQDNCTITKYELERTSLSVMLYQTLLYLRFYK